MGHVHGVIEARPSRAARVAVIMFMSNSLCAQTASREAQAAVALPVPATREERANKWVVLALSGTVAFMTTLDSSIVNTGLPSIAHAFGVPLSGTIEWVLIGYLVVIALGRLDEASPVSYLVLCLVVAWIGQRMFISPNTAAIMGAAPPNRQGVASGTLATARVIGQSLSVAVAGAVFASLGGAAAGAALVARREALAIEQARALERTFVTGLHGAFFACTAVAALGIVAALARGRQDPRSGGSTS